MQIYIMTNKIRGTLYIGVSGDIDRRMYEHRNGLLGGFTKKYGLSRLVYTESYEKSYDAISREKKLKHYNRNWKIELIEQQNPEWIDLYKQMLGMDPRSEPRMTKDD